MGHKFAQIAFTPGVQRAQERMGSRRGYARLLSGDDRLGSSEAAFVGARDSFYIASVGETGWPYIQHRGGRRVSCAFWTSGRSASRISAAIGNM